MSGSRRTWIWGMALAAACGSDAAGPSGPVAVVEVTPRGGAVAAGATLQLSAVPKNSAGTPLPGRAVTWASAATAIATVDGTGLVTGRTPGTATMTATSEGISGSVDVAVIAGPASRLAFTGQPTSATAGTALTPAVQVTARDAVGNLATTFNGTVTIGIGANPGGGTLSGTRTAAATAGTVTFAGLSIDRAGAGYTLTASATGLTSATSNFFDISTGGVSADQSSLSVLPAAVAASGGTTAATITVTARDTQGNPLPGLAVVISATGSGNIITQPSGPTNGAGIVTATLSSTVAESKVLSATISGVAVTQTDTLSVTPAASASLTFTSPVSSTVAGATITPPVRVGIVDAFGNIVTTATQNVTLAVFDNPNGGSLAGPKTVPAVAGIATFSGLSIDSAGTGYTLAASAAGLTGAVSNDFNIVPGAAHHVAFFVPPSSGTAGVSIAPSVAVAILDSLGNRVGTATNGITLAFAANPGGALLSGTTTRAAVAGVATFDNLSIDKVGIGYTLRGSATGLIAATSAPFDIASGPGTQLVFTVQPSATVAAATIAPVKVTVRDGLGNTATGFTGTVTVAFGTNAGGGTLSGGTAVTAVNGVATFSTLSVDRAGTGYTLVASAAGLGSATSNLFNVTVGPATRLAFVVQPSGASGGATIGPPVEVEILDGGGNRVAGATNSVALVLGSNPGNGSVTGTNPVSAQGGVATFSNLSVDRAGTGYTLVATATGLSSATSAPFDITVGSPARLAFRVQPSNTGGGAIIAPAVQVEVLDAGGNLVATASTSISLAFANNPGSGTLSGTTLVSAVNGVATFADLSIDNAGSGYTLSAAAGGLAGATSATFEVSVGTANKLAFIAQPSSTTGGVPINPALQVEIEDAGGNRDTNASNTITLSLGANPGNGGLSGALAVAAVKGVAIFAAVSVDSAANGYTLGASASGLTGVISSPFNVTVGPAAKVGFRTHPSDTPGGATISPAVNVEVQDAGGNRVTVASTAITVGIATNPGGGTLSGTTTVAAAAGLASFSALRIDSAGVGYRLGATATGLVGATSNPFDVTVGPPAQLRFTIQPSNVTAGSSITPAVKVEIEDAGGNRVPGATNSIALVLATNPGGGTLSGTNPVVAAGGVAAFVNLSVEKSGAGYSFRASSGSLATATSALFSVSAAGVDAAQSSLVSATDTIGQCAYGCVPGIHASAVTVTAKDRFGNLVDGAPVVLSATGSGNGFSPSGTGSTSVGGVFTASFNASVAGSKTVTATAGGVAVTQTAVVSIMPVLVGAGDIADCNSIRDDATANLLDSVPGIVFAAGDNAYLNGTAANFINCYEPTWGRHKARTRPAVGNHEYDSSSTAAPYIAYFGAAVADPLGNGFGYYGFDVGTWHVVVLNSDSAVTNPVSGQLTWLENDLVGRASQCVLAIWHRPLFTSGPSNGGALRIRRLWDVLENAGTEIVINGHDHLYERFAPQDSLGNADPAGIREFVVGTGGGETHANFVNAPPNVEASDNGNFSRGVLRLILYAHSYRWEFLHAQGQGTYADSGTAACH